jgi:hypothetical protein
VKGPVVYVGSNPTAGFRKFERLCSAPVLAFPDFKLPFILTTDASKVAIRAILSQVQNGIECPIAYASRQLKNAE